VRAARMLLTIVVALVLQTTLARYVAHGAMPVDLVLVAVAYVGLSSGPVLGLLAGTLGGLTQDALASGIVGLGGLGSTTVGFLTGVVGMQFIVAQVLPRFLVFFAATIVRALVVFGLGVLLGFGQTSLPFVPVAGQALGNALVGVALFQTVELLPGALERRRIARREARARRLQ
jgi:rod shape-determining protein MreD